MTMDEIGAELERRFDTIKCWVSAGDWCVYAWRGTCIGPSWRGEGDTFKAGARGPA